MDRKHKQKLQHSRTTHQQTARLDGSRKKRGRRSPVRTCRPGTISLSHLRHHRVQGKMNTTVRLQNKAVRLLLATLAPGKESSTSRVLEHLPNTLASSSRALEVLLSTNLLGHSHALYMSQSELASLVERCHRIPLRESLASGSSSSVRRSPSDRVGDPSCRRPRLSEGRGRNA